MSRAVAVFRNQLFKPSETFIAAQARHLRRFRPVFVGRSVWGEQQEFDVAVPDRGLLSTVRVVLGRDARPFVKALGDALPHLVHAHFAVDAVTAYPLARRLNVPLVTTLHGFDVTRTDRDLLGSGRPSLVNAVIWRKRLQQQGRLFLCVSDFIRRAALARGFPAEKLLVHHIGIDTQALQPRTGPGEDGLVVHVARLVEKKGTSYLLKALAIVRRSVPGVRLAIIGDGPLRPALEAEARALGLADHVTFLGLRPNAEVVAWMGRAAVVAVPSVAARDGDMEGFGIVNLEASAQGVAVAGFASGGIAEAVADERTGLLAPERDVAGLAERLGRLLADPALRAGMGRSARVHVEERFDIRRQTALLERHYDDVLEAWRAG